MKESPEQEWFVSAPYDPVRVRRGDPLGFRQTADWYADLLAPGLSNRPIDARWVTLLLWVLCVSRHGIKNAANAATAFNITKSSVLPGGLMVVCCDGHVEYSKLNNLWSYYWHALSVPQPMP